MRTWRILLRPHYHRLFRIHLGLRFWLADHFSGKPPKIEVPLPPARLRYYVGESLSPEMFLRIGEGCAKHIDEQVRRVGTNLADKNVLDFGCGCGRILRWLTRSYPTARFCGADVDGAAIEWCVRNLQGSIFVKSRPEPPLPFESDYFDVVYCFSVFTHLDELMQDIWLAEIKRIVKPGGIIILTVHGRKAAEGLDEKGAEELSRTGFLHRPSRKLSGLVPEWYNTTWHSEGYIVNRLGTLFTDVHYSVVLDGNQDLVVSRCTKDPL